MNAAQLTRYTKLLTLARNSGATDAERALALAVAVKLATRAASAAPAVRITFPGMES